MSRWTINVLIVCLICFLLLPKAIARLGHSTLDNLIVESHLIVIGVLGEPRKIGNPVKDKYTYSAKLKIDESWKGSPSDIEIMWTDEIHDQVPESKQRYLCFLKKTVGSKYIGTHYGRSFWPIQIASTTKTWEAVRYEHPITMVDFKGRASALLEVINSHDAKDKEQAKWINIANLKHYVNVSGVPTIGEHAMNPMLSIDNALSECIDIRFSNPPAIKSQGSYSFVAVQTTLISQIGMCGCKSKRIGFRVNEQLHENGAMKSYERLFEILDEQKLTVNKNYNFTVDHTGRGYSNPIELSIRCQ